MPYRPHTAVDSLGLLFRKIADRARLFSDRKERMTLHVQTVVGFVDDQILYPAADHLRSIRRTASLSFSIWPYILSAALSTASGYRSSYHSCQFSREI